MAKTLGIDIAKQDKTELNSESNRCKNQAIQTRHNDIEVICAQLSVSVLSFDVKTTYDMIFQYIAKHKRWLYADISGYLFQCNERTIASFLSNLDGLQNYIYDKFQEADESDKEKLSQMVLAIDKLWDHSNLAQKQNMSLHDSEEAFTSKFEKNLIPFKATFSHEMNMQFISLIAIFTALSFLVFGGITFLSNILESATHVPILELIIVGCIWSICILNLVFMFMYFASKLSGISMSQSADSETKLIRKYPLWVWSNFALLFIFSVTCWIYFINYSGSDKWFVLLSQTHSKCVSIIGLIVIGIVFGIIAIALFKGFNRHPK